MEMVTDLGSEKVVSKAGNTRSRRYGLFRCPVCLENVKIDTYYGKKANTCKECRGSQLKPLSHGMCDTPQYTVWRNMKARCNQKESPNYYRHGGRGIKYDKKWEKFEGFWEDMGPTYQSGLTIDREENNGDYCKVNCQWITKSENSSKDKFKTVGQFLLDIDNGTKNCVSLVGTFSSVIDAEKETGVNRTCIARCCRGERASSGGYGWKYIN